MYNNFGEEGNSPGDPWSGRLRRSDGIDAQENTTEITDRDSHREGEGWHIATNDCDCS